jgi:hypothetical protein
MVFYDQLSCIAGVGDLYTIGFDGVDVWLLGMQGIPDAQKRKEEQKFFHKPH